MKRNRKMALEAAWKYLCLTGDWNPYVKAFKALHGYYPVYIPQH